MAALEGSDYDLADEHYSDIVLTIRILMGKVNSRYMSALKYLGVVN